MIMNLSALDALYGIAGTGTAITYSIYGRRSVSSLEIRTRLAQGQLPTVAGVLYSAPDSTTVSIDSIILANATGNAVSGVILYDGGSAAANQITPSLTIPGNGLLTFNDQGLKMTDASGNLGATGTNSFGSTIGAPTTPAVAGTAGAATLAARNDHTHPSPGGITSRTAATSAIVNTEAQVIGTTIPGNVAILGTVYRIRAWGQGTTSSGPGNGTFRIRMGTSSLSGNIGASVAAPFVASVTAQTFYVEGYVTVTTAGASGKICGVLVAYGSGDIVAGLISQAATTGVVTVANAVALDTTADKVLELTFQSGAATASCTFTGAEISVVKM